jgi:signal transduction histidine kinase
VSLNFRILFAIFCGLILSISGQERVFAQNSDRINGGRYLVTNYSANDYNGGTQNWEFVQDSKGLIYVANRSGILQFDGTFWRTIEIDSRTPLRSLAIDQNDRIFVGAVGEFGYLAPDTLGYLSYISLSAQFDEVISDVWETHYTSHGVYFLTRTRIFRYYDGEITVFNGPSPAGRSFVVDDRIFIAVPGTGLAEVVNDTIRTVIGKNESLAANITLMALAPESLSEEKSAYLMAASGKTYLFELTSHTFKELEITADRSFFVPRESYRMQPLRNGGFAFATLASGLIITDPYLKELYRIGRESGLQINMALNVFEDTHGSIWVALNNGVSRVEMPEYVRYWDQNSGLEGTVQGIKEHLGRIFIGTSNGVYALDRQDQIGRFESYFTSTYQTWNMVSIVIDGRDYLLVPTVNGVYYIYNEQVYDLDGESTFFISPSAIKGNRIYTGLRQGWGIIELASRPNGQLRILRSDKYRNPPFEIRSIVEDIEGNLWLGSRFNGVFRIHKDSVEDVALSDETLNLDLFDISRGLPDNHDNMVLLIGDEIFLGTKNGLYSLNADNGVFERSKIFGDANPEATVSKVIAKSKDEMWITAGNAFGVLKKSNEGYTYNNMLSRLMPESPVFSFFMEEDSTLWVGGSEGLYQFNLNNVPDFEADYRTLVREVVVQRDSLIYGGHGSASGVLQLGYDQSEVTISYSAPRFTYKTPLQYKSKLEGFDKNWSPLTTETKRVYTNLPNGNYTFRVIAVDIYGIEGEEGILNIRVATPWFKSIWAWIGYIIIAGFVIFGFAQIRTRSIDRKNKQLEIMLARHTSSLQVEKRRLENINEDLRAQDDNRDKFLSVVAHDLRNPLMIIRSSADLIIEELDNKESVKELAQYVHNGSLKMQDIIENLLEDRAKKIRSDIHSDKNVDLKKLVLKLIDENQLWMERKNIDVELDLDDNCVLRGDAAQLGVIFNNLISNAIKYSYQGGKFKVELKVSNKQIIFSVQDYGQGLTAADMRDIGKPFTRLSAQPTGEEASSGMGLHIVKDLLTAQKGRLNVVSEGPSKGARFEAIFDDNTIVSEDSDEA